MHLKYIFSKDSYIYFSLFILLLLAEIGEIEGVGRLGFGFDLDLDRCLGDTGR
ncbi:hypothetical protein LguiB_001485 [Lonicera macranthoides]